MLYAPPVHGLIVCEDLIHRGGRQDPDRRSWDLGVHRLLVSNEAPSALDAEQLRPLRIRPAATRPSLVSIGAEVFNQHVLSSPWSRFGATTPPNSLPGSSSGSR